MLRSGIVTEYLDALARELSFDAALSCRVRQEVEDHFWEVANTGAGSDAIEVQHRAIANFGDPREIARQYAASSLLGQIRRVDIVVILALAGILGAMKARGAWYGLLQWRLTGQFENVRAIGLLIDFYAFMIAVAIGIIGWAYLGRRGAPTIFHKAYAKRVKRYIMLCTATAAALLASVITDAVLTGLHLLETKLWMSALVPLVSMATEIAFVSVLILNIRRTTRRVTTAWSLLCDGRL
jgi:hypothetical protein